MEKSLLTREVIAQIQSSILKGNTCEVALRHGHVIVWEVKSKKKLDIEVAKSS